MDPATVSAIDGGEMALPGGDRGPTIVAVQIVMIVTATLAVALRFIARRISGAGFWWDDWMILAALV